MTADYNSDERQDKLKQDLELSGLVPFDIRARPVDMAERAACGVPANAEGYVIPYFSIGGKAIPFYRTRLFDSEVKYKQLKASPNHVYFPPGFQKTLQRSLRSGRKYIILTEGEKKAASACKLGFPAIAFGGVDSWRNKILVVPKDVEIGAYSYNKHLIGIKLPSSNWDSSSSGLTLEPIAVGFEELTALIISHDLTAIIIYDTDEAASTTCLKPDVQRAASDLGFELRRRGIKTYNIRQLILPLIEDLGKAGLDDFLTLVENPQQELQILIDEVLSRRAAFPLYPNMEADMNKKLQNPKLSRKDIQRIALNLLTDLDGRGIRMVSKEAEQLYYFEESTSKLIKVDLSSSPERGMPAPFSKLLYKYYGISTASDIRLVKWLNTQFSGEDPIEEVNPYRVLARPNTADDCIRYQISDGQYVTITGSKKTPITLRNNGTDNVLFEAGMVEALDPDNLLSEFKKRQEEPLSMWWEDVLHEVRLKSHGRSATLFALLYYISPWLYRWRGSQLPAELVIGEAGSGKSTLCELRLEILTGQPNLRNAPTDLRDWHASISSTGALHVTDNVQFVDKSLKQRLSDEICRLITEPNPHIEMRTLYTNADLMRLKVDSVFSFTAITQPFQNSDLLQRSVILELDKLSSGSSTPNEDPTAVTYDSSWKAHQIAKFGGREAWVSHHLHVLHLFLASVRKNWNPQYQAKHRLINLEQSLVLMADLFGIESDWIPDYLTSAVEETVVEADWTLEGLSAFATSIRALKDETEKCKFAALISAPLNAAKKDHYTTASIAVWAAQHPSYNECHNLINARKLGRYMQTHKAMIAQTTSIVELPQKVNNKTMYHIKPRAPSIYDVVNPIDD